MNRFSKIVTAAAFVAGALSLSASASIITFGSYVGATAPTGFSNTPIVAGTTQATGTAVFASPYSYSSVLPGTAFVSSTSSTNAPTGTTNYFTTLNGGLAGENGIISVAADDTVQVLLNGVAIGNTVGAPYDTMESFNFTLGATNAFEFIVTNIPNGSTFNPSGVDFSGTAASTPEPSSLILLGSGLVSAAGMIIRKRRINA